VFAGTPDTARETHALPIHLFAFLNDPQGNQTERIRGFHSFPEHFRGSPEDFFCSRKIRPFFTTIRQNHAYSRGLFCRTQGTREKAFARRTRRWTQMKYSFSVSALICVFCGQVQIRLRRCRAASLALGVFALKSRIKNPTLSQSVAVSRSDFVTGPVKVSRPISGGGVNPNPSPNPNPNLNRNPTPSHRVAVSRSDFREGLGNAKTMKISLAPGRRRSSVNRIEEKI
jgi:hypothetical protein